MKLTALKCPACGGPIELDEKDENIGYCQYCHTKYYMESEQPKVFIEYKEKAPLNIPVRRKETESKTVAVTGAVIGVMAVMAIFAVVFSGGSGSTDKYPAGVPSAAAVPAGGDWWTESEKEPVSHSSAYETLIKEALGTGAASVTEEELGRFKYLSVGKGDGGWVISYSFEDPEQAGSGELNTGIKTVVCQAPLEVQDIAAFEKLEQLSLDHVELEEGSLETLTSLKSVTCSYIQLETLRQALGSVAESLESLNVSYVTSLAELTYFQGLKTLELENCREITDISPLAQVKELENLELSGMNGVTDFTVLNVMKKLKSISVDAKNLRDISFINHMPELESLGITGSQILLLDPLLGKENLKKLRLEDNGQVRDYSPSGALTGLESLVLNKYTSQEDPDLTALTGLKQGEFNGMMSIRFVGSLTGLEELKIQSCNVDKPSVIASLPNLKKLVYRKNWGNSDDLSFLAGCKGLTYLDMNRSEFYGDVSFAFNLPAMETLILDKCSFEIKFDKLQDNPALKVLSLNGLKLYKNIQIWSDGMMNSIAYDDVLLDEHTSFLAHYPSLEYLNLQSNQLTDIQFAAELKNLRELDIKDNYVTDTHVLDQLEYLGKEGSVPKPVPEVDWVDTAMDSF